MSKALRLSEKWFRRGLWLVAVVFASFLIGLGGTIVGDLPKVERPLQVDDFLDKAQAWLRFKGYEATTLRLGPLTRLGGRVGSANIAFDDHPSDKRYSDRIETVTVDSVLAWMQRTQLAAAPFTVLYQKQ